MHLMSVLSYRTAGESHGPAIIALVEGMPAGVAVDSPFIDAELQRQETAPVDLAKLLNTLVGVANEVKRDRGRFP